MAVRKNGVLDADLTDLRRLQEFDTLNIQVIGGMVGRYADIHNYWSMHIYGGGLWSGQKFQVEIHFSRRHPIEAPIIMFPDTQQNRKNLSHPLVDSDGRFHLKLVRPDKWMCVTSVLDIVRNLREALKSSPPIDGRSWLEKIARVQLHQILSMLSERDICQFSMVNKRTLDISYDNKLWAQLYYQRCKVPNTMLYIMDHPGPLRVRAKSGKWDWSDARESYIRSHQVVPSAPSIEHCAMMELPLLCDICYPETLRYLQLVRNAGHNNEMHPNQYDIIWRQHHLHPNAVDKRRCLYIALLKFRLRRLARLSRWMVGDQLISKASSIRSQILPVTSIFFFSTLDCIGGFNIFTGDFHDICMSDCEERRIIDGCRECLRKLNREVSRLISRHGKDNAAKTNKIQSHIGGLANCQPTTYLVGRWRCFECGMFNLIGSNECLCCILSEYTAMIKKDERQIRNRNKKISNESNANENGDYEVEGCKELLEHDFAVLIDELISFSSRAPVAQRSDGTMFKDYSYHLTNIIRHEAQRVRGRESGGGTKDSGTHLETCYNFLNSDGKDSQDLPPLSGGLGYRNEGLGCGALSPLYARKTMPAKREMSSMGTLHHSIPDGTNQERLAEEVATCLRYPGADRLDEEHLLVEEQSAREESEKNYLEAIRRKSVYTTTWFRMFLSEVRTASACSYELVLNAVCRWSVAEVVPTWFRPYLTEVKPACVWGNGEYFEAAFRDGVAAGLAPTSSSSSLASSSSSSFLSSSSSSSSSSLNNPFSPMTKNCCLLYGPDIYDFIELLHEVNIACSIGFRDHLEGQMVDCCDKNGSWLPGIVEMKKTSMPTPRAPLICNYTYYSNWLRGEISAPRYRASLVAVKMILPCVYFGNDVEGLTKMRELSANEDTAQYLLAFQELLESEGNGNNGQGSKSGGEEEKEEERIEQYFEKSRSLIIARSLTMSDARLHYRLGPPSQAISDARNLKRVTGPYSTKSAYSNFNMTIRKHIGADPPLTVEFVGYSSNHNEKHSRSSANIAPYRTKSSRPVSIAIESVAEIRKTAEDWGANIRLENSMRAIDSVEFKVRCFWLGATKGGGLMRMLVHPSVPLQEVINDFCLIMGINEKQCVASRIDMIAAVRHSLKRRGVYSKREDPETMSYLSDILSDRERDEYLAQAEAGEAFHEEKRKGIAEYDEGSSEGSNWDTPGIRYFDGSQTVEDARLIHHNDILDIIYSPLREEIERDSVPKFGICRDSMY